jgi:hypothetical protein
MTDTYTAIGIVGFAACLTGIFVFATRNKHHEACQYEELSIPIDDMKRINPSQPEPLLRQYGEFLDTLRLVESNGNNNAIGKSGERGAYQMTKRAWEDASDWYRSRGMELVPWETGAHDLLWSRAYAAIYLHGLAIRYIADHGVAPSPEQLFALWNCGYSGCKSFGFDVDDAPTMTRKNANKFKGVRI